MNFLNVDFAKGTTALFREAFKFKKYKAMHPFFAVVTGIFQIPFVLLSFIVAGIVYLFNFMIRIFAFPVEQLHGVVRNEKDEVKGGAQTVIYLISWPLIFFLYTLLIFSTFMLNILYIFVSVSTFIWSLGGFRFHLLLSDAGDIEKNVCGKYNKLLPLFFVIGVGLIVIVYPLVDTLIYYLSLNELDSNYLFKLLPKEQLVDHIMTTFKKAVVSSSTTFLPIFSILYTLIGFVPHPRARKAAPAVAEAVEAAVEAEAAYEEVAVEDIPVEEAPVEEAPVEEAPVEEAPVEEAPIEEAPVEEAPVEEAPVDAE